MSRTYATIYDLALHAQNTSGLKEIYPPLNDVKLSGSRLATCSPSASDFVSIFDLRQKSVMLIDGGFDEIARAALGAGAETVFTSSSFNPTSAIGRIVSAFEDSKVISSTRVIQDQYNLSYDDFDFVFYFGPPENFSKEDREKAKRASIFTSEAENIDKLDLSNFETSLAVDSFADDKFVVLSCHKKRSEAWKVINSMQSYPRPLSTYFSFSPRASSIPAFDEIKRVIKEGNLQNICDTPDDVVLHEKFSRSIPEGVHDPFYWLEYYRGMRKFVSDGYRLLDDNPYLVMFRKILAAGNLFDPGAMRRMSDEKVLRDRVTNRLHNVGMSNERDAQRAGSLPIVFFSVKGGKERMQILTNERGAVSASALDGYHRLGAAIMFGVDELSACHLRVWGTL